MDNITQQIYTVWQESFRTDFCVAKRMARPVVYHWKKVVECLTNKEKNQQCRGSHCEVITVCTRSIYDDCHENEYWTTKYDQVLLESRENRYGNIRITMKSGRRRVCIVCNHIPMIWQVSRRSWRRTRRQMGGASLHQPDRQQHSSCVRCAAARSSVDGSPARRTTAHYSRNDTSHHYRRPG